MGIFIRTPVMNTFVALCLLGLVCVSFGQECDPAGAWSCSGGLIQTLDFDDDDSVVLSQSEGTCTLFQDGNFDIDGDELEIGFDDFFGLFNSCDIAGDENDCECYEDPIQFTFQSNCDVLSGPNAEFCTRATTTAQCQSFNCPGDQNKVQDPDYEATTNGCGPQSIPFTAPSISFEECCNAHDLCYADCSKTKRRCDDEFYTCTFCSCEDEYGGGIDATICEELACLYYQAVDEFGCDAYETSQENACMCEDINDNRGKEAPRVYKEVPSKFGPEGVQYNPEKRVFCSTPFDAQCGGGDSSSAQCLAVSGAALLLTTALVL